MLSATNNSLSAWLLYNLPAPLRLQRRSANNLAVSNVRIDEQAVKSAYRAVIGDVTEEEMSKVLQGG